MRPLFQGRTGCGGRPSGWHDIVTCQHLVTLITLILFWLIDWLIDWRHTRASNENKFVPVRTDVFKYSFFSRTITDWNSLPLAVRLLQSTQSFHGLCRTRHPPTVADYHDTPAVTGGLHPLLDIAPKNRRLLTGHRQDDVDWFCVSRWGSIPHNRYETGREKPGKRWLVCVSGVWMH